MRSLLISPVLIVLVSAAVGALEPLPDKLVVLTFDDSSKTHFTVARPLLQMYGFGATFFVTEGFDFRDNKRDYMTWDEIAQLHRDGFEIGNHTRDHLVIRDYRVEQLPEQLEGINQQCEAHGIPRPISFAYPANITTPNALPVLSKHGIRFARRGGMPEFPNEGGRGVAYEPGLDHPLMIPSAGIPDPEWELEDFERAIRQATRGRIAVLQFHGVPDTAHAWVNTTQEKFSAYMRLLATGGYKVIAMRDLLKYVDADVEPKKPDGVINDRIRMFAAGKLLDEAREPSDEAELRYWLTNMRVDHGYTLPEIAAATEAALQRFVITVPKPSVRDVTGRLKVLPYPGGRHPRIGFREGAIRPQRETKFSVFAPWKEGGYIVADVPEAIWVEQDTDRELMYLAHTHIATMWSKRDIELAPLEWQRRADSVLELERKFPNAVSYTARVTPQVDGVRMELGLHNRSDRMLRGLKVQNCVMLRSAAGFEQLTNDNKRFGQSYVACRNSAGDRWIITGWEHSFSTWGGEDCPCMHADPQFPDCGPGETQRLRGWLSFYEGSDIDAELKRVEELGWR
ncbi:MAG: polysaccharide deacetylase family protein [Planctomycetota bacterium]|nr:polysaccharide deacetylase family protein [Planctomycetota bacterium]MDA1180368.1 polysaccharide deacetylase family protein [Planctomycetota bacterium]